MTSARLNGGGLNLTYRNQRLFDVMALKAMGVIAARVRRGLKERLSGD